MLTGLVALLLRRKEEVPDEPFTPTDIKRLTPPVEPQQQQYAGPLEVLLEVRASGFEKLFAGDITSDVRKSAIKIANQLPTACPIAPKLSRSDPAVVRVSDSDRGFKVRLVWPAIWPSVVKGPVRSEVRACMEALTRKVDPKLGERLLSFVAQRL